MKYNILLTVKPRLADFIHISVSLNKVENETGHSSFFLSLNQ